MEIYNNFTDKRSVVNQFISDETVLTTGGWIIWNFVHLLWSITTRKYMCLVQTRTRILFHQLFFSAFIDFVPHTKLLSKPRFIPYHIPKQSLILSNTP